MDTTLQTSPSQLLPEDPNLLENRPVHIGKFKLKDIQGRQAQEIADRSGNYMVIRKIIFRKVPKQNNMIEVVFIMPEAQNVKVIVEKQKT